MKGRPVDNCIDKNTESLPPDDSTWPASEHLSFEEVALVVGTTKDVVRRLILEDRALTAARFNSVGAKIDVGLDALCVMDRVTDEGDIFATVPANRGFNYLAEPSWREIRAGVFRVHRAALKEYLQTQRSGREKQLLPSLPVAANEPAKESPPMVDRGRRVKRKALIAENRQRWTSIDRDLRDGSTNGLSADAKADGKGWWWEGSALEWARVQGKLTDSSTASVSSVFPSRQVHRLAG